MYKFYRKKDARRRALRYTTKTTLAEVTELTGLPGWSIPEEEMVSPCPIRVLSANGWQDVNFGDWIVRESENDCYPVKHEKFIKLYVEVD